MKCFSPIAKRVSPHRAGSWLAERGVREGVTGEIKESFPENRLHIITVQ